MSIRNSMKLTQKKLKIRGLSVGENGDNSVWVQIFGDLKYTIKVEVDLIPPMATSPKGKKEGVAFLHVHATTPVKRSFGASTASCPEASTIRAGSIRA